MGQFWLGVAVPVGTLFVVGAGVYLFGKGVQVLDFLDRKLIYRMRTKGELKGGSGAYYNMKTFNSYLEKSPRRYKIDVIPGWSAIIYRNYKEG